MILSEIFDHLTYGELSQLAIGGNNTDGIKEADYKAIVGHINLALTELYKRFPLKLNSVAIQLYDHITNYKLHSDYAITNESSTETYKYIIDSPYYPFTDDVLMIERVINENAEELPLNDTNEYYSLFTPMYNVVQVPYPDLDNAIEVQYKAAPTKIDTTVDGFDPDTTEVVIPNHMLEPLLTYVAYRIYTGNKLNKGSDISNLYSKFNALCAEIDYKGLVNKDINTNLNFWRNGWA